MIEVGQLRFMRDGTVVKVLDIVMRYDHYWKREMPFAKLQHPDGVIYRRTPTVESYLLVDYVPGTLIMDPM